MTINIEVLGEEGELLCKASTFSFEMAGYELARLERFIQMQDKALFVKSFNSF